MTEEQLPGILHCRTPGCGFRTTPTMEGGAKHHTIDNPGHWMTDAPPHEIVEDEAPIKPESVLLLRALIRDEQDT